MLILSLILAAQTADPVSATLTDPPPPPDLSSYTLAPPRCDAGAASPSQRAALADYDFLIGDYSVTGHMWLGDRWSPPRPGVVPARWNGWYGLDGGAILDEWFDVDPGTDPDAKRGINARMVDGEGNWVMSWISDHSLAVQHLTARKGEDGWLRMVQSYPERRGFEATFVRVGADRWGRIHVEPGPEGELQPAILLMATRIPCPG